MTKYTALIAQLREKTAYSLLIENKCHEAAASLESLTQERDSLLDLMDSKTAYFTKLTAERDTLQARLTALEGQEAVVKIGDVFQLLWCRKDWSKGLKVGDCLYPAAGAVPASAAVAQTEPAIVLEISAEGVLVVGDPGVLGYGTHKLYRLQPASAKPLPLTDEQERALCEAYCNNASDDYFNARPSLDNNTNRNIFYAGHRKAWIEYEAAHGIKEIE